MRNKYEPNLFYLYFQILKKYKGYMEKNLEIFDLSPVEIDILTFIMNNRNKDITAKDISLHRGISKSLVSKGVNSLKEKDIIKIIENPDDGRSFYLTIRDFNSELSEKIKLINSSFERILMEDIELKDFDLVLGINNRMLSNIDKLD